MNVILPIAALLLTLPTHAGEIFAPGSEWETVSEGHQFAEGMAFDKDGHLLFTDVPRGQLFRVDRESGEKTLLDGETGRANGIAFGPDGRLYGCAAGDKKIYAWDPATWQKTSMAEGPHSNDIAVRRDGTIFFTDPQTNSVWRVTAGERTLEKAAALDWNPNGITLSPDHGTLFVAEFSSNRIHAFAIAADNSLGDDTIGYVLNVPEDGKGNLDGMMILPDGRVLSGTVLGAQITARFDKAAPPSPVTVIPIPRDLPRCNYVRLSPDGKWLYAAHAKAILRRELAPTFAPGRG